MRFRLAHISLRARFILGLGAVLLPFLLAAVVGLFYLLPRLVEPMEKIMAEIIGETEPIRRLQEALLMAAMPPNDYLIHGDPAERGQFATLSGQVDSAFEKVNVASFGEAAERAGIEAAYAEWQRAWSMGEAILRLRAPQGNSNRVRDMENLFDAHIDRTVALLDQVHDVAHREIDEDWEVARAAKTRSVWVTFVAFMLALAISTFAGAALARSVMTGVDALRAGATRLAAGELSHRVVLDHQDELGQLAKTFNAMAEQLEKSQEMLKDLSVQDGLTGLYNHRAFYAMLADELVRAQRFNRPVSLLMLDIDYFKRVNDLHGHLAGDAVLKGLSERLGRQARSIDRICRYGGEEFTVILPETDLEAAANVAERLRAAVDAQPFDVNTGAPMRITVSIGVAAFPEDAGSEEELIAAADRALYSAKQAGRNRVCAHQPDAERKTRSR